MIMIQSYLYIKYSFQYIHSLFIYSTLYKVVQGHLVSLEQYYCLYFLIMRCLKFTCNGTFIVYVWSRNGANRTKAFVKWLLAPEMKIAGGATC